MRTQDIYQVVTNDKSDFLAAVAIDHGPVSLLGHFVLKAQSELQKMGLSLSFGTFEELLAVNAENSQNWRPLFPVFDCRNGGINYRNSFCVFGRDHRGEIVVCHAARLFDWSKTTCYEEIKSLRLFYSEAEDHLRAGERCVVTAQSTHDISGVVIFSGAAWIRPDYRGKKWLPAISSG
jgi:hypothetical protein